MKTDFYDLIEKRASCRSFKPDPIPGDVLERILAAACRSPSGGGFQSVSIVVIDDAEKRRELVKMSRGQNYLGIAPVSLVFCVDYHRMAQVINIEPAPCHETMEFECFWMSLLDVGIMAQTAVIAAEAEGLKSCFNGNVINVADRLTEMLELPDKVFPALMLTLGYPKVERKQPTKYPPEILVHRNSYKSISDEACYKAYRKQNDYRKFSIKEHWLEKCCAEAEKYYGREYALRVREDIEKKGYIGPYQYWFGCWYQDEPEFLSNSAYRDFFRKQGFEWLEFDDNKTEEK